MKIRLMGTDAECAAALTALRFSRLVRVTGVDGPYLNRRDTRLRLYIDAEVTTAETEAGAR
ncbi:hypothetical protein QTQ03_12450 [Micromonospora sp. WMMA1363]|uniref:hypothetical protein n=1 Tax=Micromonospora sp. WMMA1363 TaxID=3053985 RepID=UPI00259C921E|nr:hypothetical protein [Micromonospora sp. WMMA1363]MDM4720344.1 hypothetical protein [Micromonospora sp. WMMA1363]